jgi:hypothetical protein
LLASRHQTFQAYIADRSQLLFSSMQAITTR